MCQFIESIKIENGEAELLPFHLERINRTFKYWFKQKPFFNLDGIVFQHLNSPQKGRNKLRMVYNQYSINKIELLTYQIPEIKSLRVVSANDIEYSFKYLDRNHLNQLFLQRQSCHDIIIVKNGEVSDSLFCNLLFKKGNRLFTPSKPLLAGTRRAFYLSKGWIEEQNITINDMDYFEGVYLINSMLSLEDNLFVERRSIFI